MDWSLVLASQGMQPVIAPPGELPQWGLLVAPEEFDQALEAIKQYRVENAGWGWRKELPGAQLEIHTGAAVWCLILGLWDWLANFIFGAIQSAGHMDSVAVRKGEWWRLFTAVMLHADLAHLAANVTFGLLILGLAMARFGWGLTLLLTYLAGAAGNVLGLFMYSRPYTGVGASGMMMGALGLLSVHSVSLWRQSPKAARYVMSGVAAGLLLFVLFGFSPNSDILAHLGGFVAGIAFGTLLSFMPEKSLQRGGLNLTAGFALLVLVAAVWFAALSHAPILR